MIDYDGARSVRPAAMFASDSQLSNAECNLCLWTRSRCRSMRSCIVGS